MTADKPAEHTPEHATDVPLGDTAEPSGPRFSRKTLVLSGVALLAVMVLGLPVFSVLQPHYYERYPGLGERMGNWQSSTHARVSCVECHVDPGLAGAATFAARAIPAFYSQLINGASEENLLDAPGIQACEKCHTSFRQVSPDGDLLIPHRAHVQVLGTECVVCHKDLVHSLNEKGFNRPAMTTCLETCHDGEQATEVCTKCHTRKHAPDTHLAADWLAEHGEMSETMDCGSCHDWTPDYCGECHSKRPATHAGNWKKAHAERAKKHPKGCYVCHDEQEFCGECH